MQRTPLHIAAEEGSRDKVLLLLSHGAEAHATDKNLWTPLHCAASQSFFSLIEPLVEKGAPLNAQTREGSTALSYIPKSEDTPELYAAISFMIARGANPNLANSHGEIPLHKACFKGRIHAIRALLERGSAVNTRARNLETPLHFAVKAGRAAAVRLLLERGADPNAPSEAGTPLKMAATSTPEVQQAMTEIVSTPFLDIHLRDFSAADLPKKTFGSIDPYLVVRLDSIEMRSEVIHKNSNPVFRFSAQMTYPVTDLAALAEKNLTIDAYDGTEHLGGTSLDLHSLTVGPATIQGLSLIDRKGGGKGKRGKISFVAEVTYKRRCFAALRMGYIDSLMRHMVFKNLRPASNAPHQSWKNDVFFEYQAQPFMPARSPVVYNTYEPSWQDLAPLSICAGLKELLAPKKMKVQAFNIYKGDTELLGECDLDLRKVVLSTQSHLFREDLSFRGAALGSLECQVVLQHVPEVGQCEGYRNDDGYHDIVPLTDYVPLPKGCASARSPNYTREPSASPAGPVERATRHRKVADLVEMLKQQSQKGTAELADLVWRDDTARDGFREEHGFAPLCKLLIAEGDLQREAARLLLNVLFEHTRNQESFRIARGIPALIEALNHGRSAAQLPLVLSVAALAARDSQSQQAICDANGIPTLVGILSSSATGHVKLVVASTLGKLCYCAGAVASSKIPDVIRLAGGMRALVELLLASDVEADVRPAVWEAAIMSLKILYENSVDNQKALPGLLGPLLASPDSDIQLLACAIIRDISSRSEDAADICMQAVGLARFLTVLSSPHEAVRTEALIVFKQLFRKNSKGSTQPQVDASSLASCIALLQSNDPTVLRIVFKILKRLARSPAVAVELAVSGAAPRVVAHLRSPDPIMQKKALGLIALLAQESKARESLHDLDFSLLTQFLGVENQKLQSLACNVVTLLLGDSQRKHDLSRAGALPAVVKLLKGDDLALLATALQLLQGFSDANENRPVLLDCGVMTGLESVIRLYGDSELLLPALAIIQSLCSSPKAEAAIVNSPIISCFEVLLAHPYPNPQARDALQKILNTIGYSTGVCTQAHRAQPSDNMQQDFYHCITCSVLQPGGICEGCALVCHKGHQLSAKYRDHIICTCGAAPNKLCQSMTLTKPVPAPIHVCGAAFGKANRPQSLFRCRTCWADSPKHVCKRCAEACHKGHTLDNMNTIAGTCACNDRVYNKCNIFNYKGSGAQKSPASSASSSPAVPAAAAAAPAAPSVAAKIEERGECIICMDAPKEALFYKCGHIASCLSCAQGMMGKPCPICRETILDVVKIFKI